MSDCANVEMRELLPELAAGTLDASTRARVEGHLVGCAECASELETLRNVRRAFAVTPALDVRRIVAALPKPVAPATTPAPVKRWVDWRIAAALTMITVGGLSVAVTQRIQSRPAQPPVDTALTVRAIDSRSQVAVIRTIESARSRVDSGDHTAQMAAPRTKAQLSFNGGVSDLDEASIQALLGALDEMDRTPVAPSAEPDRSSVLPVIKEGDR
ncbi:MAG TPA: zf-HC2 domain-containing protein [Gemmatimonadaceae bacterium]|nr:zf-HC2 domain-containing protein [Gemmatimonadaceae bacterium]